MAEHKKRMTKSDRTKAKIFEMAWNLFKERGFDNVSLQDIADHTGTAKEAYTYFRRRAISSSKVLDDDGYYNRLNRRSCANEPLKGSS